MCYSSMGLLCSRKAAERIDLKREKLIILGHEVQEASLVVEKYDSKSNLSDAEKHAYEQAVENHSEKIQQYMDAISEVAHAREEWFMTPDGQMYLHSRITQAKAKGERDGEAEYLARVGMGRRESELEEFYKKNPTGFWNIHEPSADEVLMAMALADDEHTSDMAKARYVGKSVVAHWQNLYSVTEYTPEGFVTLRLISGPDVEGNSKSQHIHHIPLADIRLWLV